MTIKTWDMKGYSMFVIGTSHRIQWPSVEQTVVIINQEVFNKEANQIVLIFATSFLFVCIEQTNCKRVVIGIN